MAKIFALLLEKLAKMRLRDKMCKFCWDTLYKQKYGQRETKNYGNTDKWTDKNMEKQKDKKWIAIQTKIWTSEQMEVNNKKWTNKQTIQSNK